MWYYKVQHREEEEILRGKTWGRNLRTKVGEKLNTMSRKKISHSFIHPFIHSTNSLN